MEYKPHPKQLAAHQSEARFKVLNWGRQVGKSFFALQYTLEEAMKRQGRYWIVLPTYRQAKEIYWHQYVKTYIPKELIQKTDEQNLVVTLKYADVTLPDGTIIEQDRNYPPSTIELKGSDDADRLRGAKVNGFVFDEYAFHRPEAWEMVFEPMLLTTDGWAMFISTPNGYNHFWDMVLKGQKNKGWFYSHASVYDNPYIKNAEIERIKSERSENKFAQEYMAEFRKMEGVVYREWDRDIHVIPPEKVPKNGTYMMGIDFGYTNPTAVVFVVSDYDNNWYIYDEIYIKQRVINDIAEMIKEKTASKNFSVVAGDGAQAEHIANLNRLGIPVVAFTKKTDNIQGGIDLIREMLTPREQLQGKPKPKLYVSANCENFINEIEQYCYPERADGTVNRNEKEQPIKENDHLMDALRYLKLMVYYPISKNFDFPTTNAYEDIWG